MKHQDRPILLIIITQHYRWGRAKIIAADRRLTVCCCSYSIYQVKSITRVHNPASKTWLSNLFMSCTTKHKSHAARKGNRSPTHIIIWSTQRMMGEVLMSQIKEITRSHDLGSALQHYHQSQRLGLTNGWKLFCKDAQSNLRCVRVPQISSNTCQVHFLWEN